jgi:hypothetical protein
MDQRWKYTEQMLKKLLLVTHVQLNVPVKPTEEEYHDEASQSTQPSRTEETAKDCKMHQARRPK